MLMAGLITILVENQRRLSKAFDQLLPEQYQIDGRYDFTHGVSPRYLGKELIVYDIGGGSAPFVDGNTKQKYGMGVVGLDVDDAEMRAAPAGIYDEIICSDIMSYRGKQEADLVICRCVLEHVDNIDKAFMGIASAMKPGGTALIFVPSRHAWFARLNKLLPDLVRTRLLYSIYPHMATGHSGFRPMYHKCYTKTIPAGGLGLRLAG
jgi:SAM-dependent methyltransferase